MDVKKAALLAGALIIAVAAALMARSMFSGGGTPNGPAAPQATAAAVPQQALDGPQVLVATRALPVGTIIDARASAFNPGPRIWSRRPISFRARQTRNRFRAQSSATPSPLASRSRTAR